MNIYDVLLRIAYALGGWAIWTTISTVIYFALNKRYEFSNVHGCVGLVICIVLIYLLIKQ